MKWCTFVFNNSRGQQYKAVQETENHCRIQWIDKNNVAIHCRNANRTMCERIRDNAITILEGDTKW